MDNALNMFLMGDVDGLNLNLILNIAEHLAQPLPVNNEIRRRIRRNQNYFEIVVPQYFDDQFKEHFRMSRVTFNDLINVIGQTMGEDRGIIPLSKKIMYTVWMLSKPESFLAAGDRFGIAPSSGHYILKEITTVITSLLPQYITWPNVESYRDIASIFQERSRGITGVVGAIDGCHISIKQPPGNANDFYNRKGFHSIILQAVCDHNAKFIDVFIGLPGRMHDARVFRNSPLFRKLNDEANPLLPLDYHIIGDAAYPLKTYLLTPFRDTGHLDHRQTTYNVRFSSIRSIVERSFAFLEGKFRRLKYLDVADLELANNIVASACVLHNFIIEHHDIEGLEEAVHNLNDNEGNDGWAVDDDDPTAPAIQKRNAIVNILQ